MTDLVCYVARYGRQDIDALECWPLSKLRRYAAGFNRLIKQEGGGSQED